MTITQHLGDESLAAFAAGSLDEGRRMVAAAHIDMCVRCRRWQSTLEHVGGALLMDAAPESMSADALAKTLARLDGAHLHAMDGAWPRIVPDEGPLPPAALGHHATGRWSWIGRGIHHRPVALSGGPGARVFLLKVDPGVRLPHHTHTGTEMTLVLSGAFEHAGGRFGPGDIEEADESVDHVPVVEAGEACVCLVAMEGKLRLLGPMGRLLQPLVRF